MDLLKLAENDEKQFQSWIKALPWFLELSKEIGSEPDINTPLYDYRRAWKSGITPELVYAPEKQRYEYHWPSVTKTGEWLKDPVNHPTAWMEHFLQKNGPGAEAALNILYRAMKSPMVGAK